MYRFSDIYVYRYTHIYTIFSFWKRSLGLINPSMREVTQLTPTRSAVSHLNHEQKLLILLKLNSYDMTKVFSMFYQPYFSTRRGSLLHCSCPVNWPLLLKMFTILQLGVGWRSRLENSAQSSILSKKKIEINHMDMIKLSQV